MPRRAKGEGTLRFRQDGRYEATLLVTDDLGRSKRKYFYGRTEREAINAREAWKADHARGRPVDPNRVPLSTYLADWLQGDATTHVSPPVLVTYELVIRRHISPLVGHIPMSGLTPQLVQAMVDELGRLGKLAPASIAKARSILQSAMGDAVRRGIVPDNPAALTRVSHARRKEIDYWQPAEAKKFLQVLQGNYLEAFYTLSLMIGWRVSEGLGLAWSDIDLEHGTLTIRRGLERGSRTSDPKFTPTKNNGSRRTIKLPQRAIAVLKYHRALQAWMENIADAGEWVDGQDFVFVTSKGRPLSQSNIRRQFLAFCKRAGVRPIRVHDMRHTAATMMLRSGVPIHVVSKTLGHSSIRVTVDIYGHLLDDEKQELADAMDRLMGA